MFPSLLSHFHCPTLFGKPPSSRPFWETGGGGFVQLTLKSWSIKKNGSPNDDYRTSRNNICTIYVGIFSDKSIYMFCMYSICICYSLYIYIYIHVTSYVYNQIRYMIYDFCISLSIVTNMASRHAKITSQPRTTAFFRNSPWPNRHCV